jgi:hypothetical protein
MSGIGHTGRPLIRGARWGAFGALAALLPALALWGFTVDDALISVRYARHVAAGIGWRFNPHGPPTDGVTPLPWPVVLAPFARTDALRVLGRAKAIGVVASLTASVALGRAVGALGRAPVWFRGAVLVVYGLSVPVAAYAVSGMETAVCGALATFAALCLASPIVAAALAGVAVAFRPEMGPWAVVLASGAGLAAGRGPGRAIILGLVALVPFAGCTFVRIVAFGHAAPLAVLAKPSDLEHGVAYAAAAALVSLAPVLVVAPRALACSPRAAVIAAAGLAHGVAIAMAGGDWMPFGRLMAPIVPSLCYAGALTGEHARRIASAVRVGVALVLGLGLDLGFWHVVRDGRRVTADRTALVEAALPVLGPLPRVAALDVGWVGAATDADILDLAGLTDPQIAALPGGHTSKRVGVVTLLDRDPDALVLFAPSGLTEGGLADWDRATYGRAVERGLASDPVLGRHFVPAAWLPLGTNGAGYVVLRAVR